MRYVLPRVIVQNLWPTRISRRRSVFSSRCMQSSRVNDYKHGLVCLSPKTRMETVAAGLSRFEPTSFTPSPFVIPASVTFHQTNGSESRLEQVSCSASDTGRLRKWDYIETHDSIAVLLYEKEMHAVLMVRQFRPTVYARALRKARKSNLTDPPFVDGFTYELCAGLVDKEKSLVEIAHEEIMEECGYNVPISAISEIAQFVTAIGTEGTTQTLFFAEAGFSTKKLKSGAVYRSLMHYE